MTYCLNPNCPYPKNRIETSHCQACGSILLLANRYRPLRLIGQGGFGRTFLAVDEAQPAKPACVIKQFMPQSQGSLYKAAQLFRQEAVQLEELGQHPQIPALCDHFEIESQLYLVQEYINGQNLAQELGQTGAFSEAQIYQLLSSLLPVLQFIHSRQVIHRDIKPENIIRRKAIGATHQRSSAGNAASRNHRNDLVLVDFGASKTMTETSLDRTGTRIGSAGFSAPEQVIGKAVYASDLYSLGVTCIHLLTQKPPFELYSVREGAWIWQDYLRSPISDHLTYLLEGLLEVATRQRYQSAEEVMKDLNAQVVPKVQRYRHPRPPKVPPRININCKFERIVLTIYGVVALIMLNALPTIPAVLLTGSAFCLLMYLLNHRFQSFVSVAEKFRLRGNTQSLKREIHRVEASLKQLTDAQQKLTKELERKTRDIEAQRLVYDQMENEELARIEQDLKHRLAAIQAEQKNLVSSEETELNRKLKRLQAKHRKTILSSHTLAEAHISGIGKALTQALENAGIITAADVELERITQVNGVGEAKASNLVTWRQQVEAEIMSTMPETLAIDQQLNVRTKYQQRAEDLANQEAEARQAARFQKESVLKRCQQQRTFLTRQLQTSQQQTKAALADLQHRFNSRQQHLITLQERLARVQGELEAYRQISFVAYLRQILFLKRPNAS